MSDPRDEKSEIGHTSWIALRSALGISILAAGPVSTQLGILVGVKYRRWGGELFKIQDRSDLWARGSEIPVGLGISGACTATAGLGTWKSWRG